MLRQGLLGAAAALCLVAACGDSGDDAAGGGGSSQGGASSGSISNGSMSNGSMSNGSMSSGSTAAGSNASSGATMSSSASSAGTGGGTATGQWVLGYYVGYAVNDYPIDEIDWSGLTHVAFAPLLVNGDHSLDFSFFDENGNGPGDAAALVAAAHAHGVKALLMLGGEGAGPNIAAAASAPNRAAFVSALVSALGTLGGYDGIDLDWEDSVDLDDLVALAQDLRAAKPDIVLSYPAGAINGNFQTVDPHMPELAASLDRFMVQTYYPSTAVAGFGWESWFNSPVSGVTAATPIAIDDTLQRYADAGIPKNKLGFGMSFYAICYTGGISAPHQPTNGTSQQIVGGDNAYPLSDFFAAGSTFDMASAAERKVDPGAEVPYLSLSSPVDDPGCGAATRYISYDDETSIIAKGTFSRTNGYGGIIVWTINQGLLPPGAADGRPPNALMQALKQGFIDP
jgi:chitinase